MSIGGFIRHSVANKEVKEAPPADVPYLIRAMRQPQFRKGLEELRTATKLVSDAYTSGTG